jgi:hypothetical protein
LADDDLLQLFLHQPPMLAEFLQDVAQTARLSGQIKSFVQRCSRHDGKVPILLLILSLYNPVPRIPRAVPVTLTV